MTTHFVLVRHGTCSQMDSVLFGREVDAPLDGRGARQALAVAEKLSDLEPHRTVIETSPRLRTQQTARAIAERVRCPLNISSVLDEVDYGRWAGCSFAELAGDPDWQRWNEQRSRNSTPAGETIAALQVRLLHYLDRLCTRFGDDTVVLVTHAELIRALLMHCLDVPIDDFQRVPVEAASLTFIHPESGRFIVTASNVRPDA
jgi:ribonuclease H / adenosylcobalamin/alpha-ribazole phosphatase